MALLSAVGCTGWRPEPGGVIAAMGKKPDKLRITRTDSTRAVLSAPSLTSDTLTGQPERRKEAPVKIPTEAILAVETRGTDGTKTVTLLGGIGMVIVIGVIAAQNAVEDALGDSFDR